MKRLLSKKILAYLAITAVAASFAYGGYRYYKLYKEKTALRGAVAELQDDISKLQESLVSTKSDLDNARGANDNLSQALQAEENKNSAFAAQIKDISGAVTSLQKLSATDPELLKKYSKVYFLNDNYVPTSLSAIDSKYLYDKTRPELVHSGVLPYLTGLLAAAARDGENLQIVSAYRSFYEQATLKLGYK